MLQVATLATIKALCDGDFASLNQTKKLNREDVTLDQICRMGMNYDSTSTFFEMVCPNWKEYGETTSQDLAEDLMLEVVFP